MFCMQKRSGAIYCGHLAALNSTALQQLLRLLASVVRAVNKHFRC